MYNFKTIFFVPDSGIFEEKKKLKKTHFLLLTDFTQAPQKLFSNLLTCV